MHPGPHGLEVLALSADSDLSLDLEGLLGLAIVAEYGYPGIFGQVLSSLVEEVVCEHDRLIVYDLHQSHEYHIGHTRFAGCSNRYGLLLLQGLFDFCGHLNHFKSPVQ